MFQVSCISGNFFFFFFAFLEILTAETDYSLVPDFKDVYYSEQL